MTQGTQFIHLRMNGSLYFLKGFHVFTHQLLPQGFFFQSVLASFTGISYKASKICLSLQFLLGGHAKSVLFIDLDSFFAHYVYHPFELIAYQPFFPFYLDFLYIVLSSHSDFLQFLKDIILSNGLQTLYCPLILSLYLVLERFPTLDGFFV